MNKIQKKKENKTEISRNVNILPGIMVNVWIGLYLFQTLFLTQNLNVLHNTHVYYVDTHTSAVSGADLWDRAEHSLMPVSLGCFLVECVQPASPKQTVCVWLGELRQEHTLSQGFMENIVIQRCQETNCTSPPSTVSVLCGASCDYTTPSCCREVHKFVIERFCALEADEPK